MSLQMICVELFHLKFRKFNLILILLQPFVNLLDSFHLVRLQNKNQVVLAFVFLKSSNPNATLAINKKPPIQNKIISGLVV